MFHAKSNAEHSQSDQVFRLRIRDLTLHKFATIHEFDHNFKIRKKSFLDIPGNETELVKFVKIREFRKFL